MRTIVKIMQHNRLNGKNIVSQYNFVNKLKIDKIVFRIQ